MNIPDKAQIGRMIMMLSVFWYFNVTAQIKLPNVIGSNMVLQSKQLVPIWGWSRSKSSVTVSFKGQQISTKADNDGYWESDAITFTHFGSTSRNADRFR